MYYPLNTWKSHLCKFDCESLFVSYALPCHVYAKLRKGSYAYHLMIYLFMWATIQFLYSYGYYLNVNACPLYKTDKCIYLNESECNQHYMKVDSAPSKCIYRYNMCEYDTYECITPTHYASLNLFLGPLTCIMYIIIYNLHFKLRKEIQETHKIPMECKDCLAVTCCSTCGLAQAYREVEV
jgi:Cys-rich protein (TIGR01571 family)